MTATKTAKPAKATPAKAAAPAAGVDPVTDYRVQLIALADIDVSLNPRTSFEDDSVAELAASIQAVGLAQPITVEDTGGQPAYRLIIGGRRIAAYRFNDQTHIPAFVRAAGEPATVAATRLVENIQRTDLSPLDEAAALHELTTSHGKTQAEVARLIGRNQGHVSKRIALLRLSAKGAAMLNSGALPLDAAGDIAKLPAMLQNSVLTTIQGGTTPEAAVRQARAKVAELKERGELIKRLEKAHTPVIDRAGDRAALPEDVRRFHGDEKEWAADPGRLAEVRRTPDAWRQGDDKWLVRYTTTASVEQLDGLTEFGGGGDSSGQPQYDTNRPQLDTAAADAATAAEVERVAQYTAAEQARLARAGELRDFIRTLINGKISDSWARFLVRLSLITAIAGDPDDAEGCPAAVSSAGEALQLPNSTDYDFSGYETLTAVLGQLQADNAPGTLLRLALGSRLLNGLRFLARPDLAGVIGAEVLAFLRSQGLELAEAEAELADRRSWALEGVCVEYEMVQGRPDVEEPVDERPAEDRISDGTVYTGGSESLTEADLAALAAAAGERPDEATGDPADDFDAPVETFRPDHSAEATLTAAEIDGMTRPVLIELAAARKVETTPRMTRLQLAATLKKALLDPADDIS